MILSKENTERINNTADITSSKKRRIRRKLLKEARAIKETTKIDTGEKIEFKVDEKVTPSESTNKTTSINIEQILLQPEVEKEVFLYNKQNINLVIDKQSSTNMSSNKSREEVLAAREAKKLAKLKAKNKGSAAEDIEKENMQKEVKIVDSTVKDTEKMDHKIEAIPKQSHKIELSEKTYDEVDRAIPMHCQGKKKSILEGDITGLDIVNETRPTPIVNRQPEESLKSNAELKAERRAKQEAQRAAKRAALQQKDVKQSKTEPKAKSLVEKRVISEVKSKVEKTKSQPPHRFNWFQHLYTEQDKKSLKEIAINSNLHPAIIKLGVQLSARVVSGSNARCIALLDALKKMVTDYVLPAKTEFARGLESHLAASLDFLWSMRQPSATQTNAVKFFRHRLTQLPNNIDEFDAKKILQEEIDRYIREQIDMAGEAISIAVRNKITEGDNILTYGCSSLIERILCEAWDAGVKFRAVVVGSRVNDDGREMLRRLILHGVPCVYIDITAISFVMKDINKVLLGASALLVNGSVLGAAGTAQTALVARCYNVPVLVPAETHKFCDRVCTDAFVYNEIGNPDDLLDKSDGNSPLKDWRCNPNLTPLNLTYDVTPPSLVTAVVTELAILPCTSAPVVLRFKLSEYGI